MSDWDRRVYFADIQKEVRKIVLETVKPGKRTLTVTTDRPVEGSNDGQPRLKSASEIFEELNKKKMNI